MLKLVTFLALLCLARTRTLAHQGSYAVWAADSAISRAQGNGLDATGSPLVSYEHGEFQWGLIQLYEKTNNRTYFNYIQEGIDNIVYDNGTVHGSYAYVYLCYP